MTRDQILQLARAVADQEGWIWMGQVDVSRRRRYGIFGRFVWSITTNTFAFGCNVRIQIDDESGMVLSKAFAPR